MILKLRLTLADFPPVPAPKLPLPRESFSKVSSDR
jgi:hypothetical protein